MEVFDGHEALFRPLARPTIALGNFDGVHLGHQELLARVRQSSRENDGDSVVFTFEPHPAHLLQPQRIPPRLCSWDRKVELLAEHGINVVIKEEFTASFAEMPADEFVERVLVRCLHAKKVVVGHDFRFGRDRSGDTKKLEELGAAHGFATEVVEPYCREGIRISSTEARKRLAAGDLLGTKQILGRDPEAEGVVVRGQGRGTGIGVPTANLQVPSDLCLPAQGVYATWATILDGRSERFMAATNLGTNPTFATDGAPMSLEAHLLDFSEDIYGKTVRLSFVEALRGEQRFPDVDQLIAQIRKDVDETRSRLCEEGTK